MGQLIGKEGLFGSEDVSTGGSADGVNVAPGVKGRTGKSPMPNVPHMSSTKTRKKASRGRPGRGGGR